LQAQNAQIVKQHAHELQLESVWMSTTHRSSHDNDDGDKIAYRSQHVLRWAAISKQIHEIVSDL